VPAGSLEPTSWRFSLFQRQIAFADNRLTI
jgi:hypothetical protein